MEQTIKSFVIATGNRGKLEEFRDLFSLLPVNLLSLADFADVREVPETGSTFAENAELKARGYAVQIGMWAIADDSGLEVSALGRRPGVYSARYGGEDLGFDAKMMLILQEMAESGAEDRTAQFVCAISVADPDGKIIRTELGECVGRIAFGPRGAGGFGYDPIFIPDGSDLTFGELPLEMKAAMSHRARAASKIMRYLLDFTGVPT